MEEQLKSRRELTREQTDQILNTEIEEIESAVNEEQHRQQKKADKRQELESSLSYGAVKGIKTVMDDYYLDPLLGLIPGGVGDWLTAPLVLPAIYVALFKVHSIALTLAVIYNWLVDACLGSIPFIGSIIDFIYKGHKKNYQMIVGYVEDDREIISEVNGKAFKTLILIAILGVALYYLIKLAIYIWDWFWGLFT